ncbi:hypothetical protein CLUP02_17749 [Colletotrichum lupini]|uniref:Uncharacterized protein n=1 Tax=Colletotrichum lupini TaxID=145971 RepID=A0A9Q8WAN4_9PEZI|nr:hypothetical protein CLUP02_17749 [Colletotrichum lupini]
MALGVWGVSRPTPFWPPHQNIVLKHRH